MRRDQKGFSLVELIIVVAILAIILGIGVRNLGVIQQYNNRETQDKLINAIKAHKVDALSKSVKNNGEAVCSDVTKMDAYLKIEKDGSFYYVTSYMPGSNRNPARITKSRGTKIYFVLDNAAAGTEILAASPLYLSFNRSTGAFLPYTNAGGTKSYVTGLIITTGSYQKFVSLEGKTGKVLRGQQ